MAQIARDEEHVAPWQRPVKILPFEMQIAEVMATH